MSLAIFNDFKYSFPADAATPDNARRDGPLGFDLGHRLCRLQAAPPPSLGVGISSFQPALDSRYRYPRFPFWDFSGANANNYSQIFLSVGGSL